MDEQLCDADWRPNELKIVEDAKEVPFLRNGEMQRKEGRFLHWYVFAVSEEFLFPLRQVKLYHEVLPHL